MLDAHEVVSDLVRRRLGIGHLEVDDRVDAHDEVVLGDDRLRRERDDLLTQVHTRADLVYDGDHEGQSGVEGAVVATEALDDASVRLRHDLDGRGNERHCHYSDDDGGDECFHDPSRLTGDQGSRPVDLEHVHALAHHEDAVAVVGAG